MTRDDEASFIAGKAYAAVLSDYERLELTGRLFGNGHHAAQKVARFVEADIKARWMENDWTKTEKAAEAETV